MLRPPRGDSPAPAMFAAAGALWALFLFFTFGFAAGTAPAGAGGWAALALLVVALGAAHAGIGGALAALCGRRSRRWLNWAAALAAGALYALLVLSVVKLVVLRSHLELVDLRFLSASFGQIFSEGTGAERRLIAAALALPLLIALAVRGLGGLLAPRLAGWSARRYGALAAAGVAGAIATGALAPPARRLAAELVPETRLVVHLFLPGEFAGDDAGLPDPALQARRESYRAGEFQRFNVLIVMLESISPDRLFGPRARPASTPRLLAFADQSVVFDQAWATATHSDYAQTSILASLHPRKFDHSDGFSQLDYPRTLPWDLLGPLGYRSGVFSCQNEKWGNMIAFLRTPALGTFRDSLTFPGAPRHGKGRESKAFEETVVGAFLDWLDAGRERPFVAYLNFQATHFSYEIPPGAPAIYSPNAIDFPATFLGYPRERTPVMLNRWHNALAYVDAQFGRLLDGLAARGIDRDTVVLVVADHGEAFYDYGQATHGTTLLPDQLQSVLMLRFPAVLATAETAPRHVSAPVSLLDALPALYRALGLPRHGNFQGRDDILEAGYSGAGRPILATVQGLTREDGVVRDGLLYFVDWDRREAGLRAIAPGAAGTDLGSERPEQATALRRELRTLLGRQLGYYERRLWRDGWFPPRLP